MKDLVSIIVPVYNVEKFLDKCITSIKKQTYKNIEIILVDDGSVDSCPAMCDKYATEDGRIKVIHKENGGLSSARNAGLDIASGEYVLFVDSDDYIEAELCETVLAYMSEDVDIVAFGFKRVFDEGEEKVEFTGRAISVSKPELFQAYINRENFTHMVCDKMFRHNLFQNMRFIEGRLAEDLAISYKLFGNARKAVAIDTCFYNYYTRSNSIMGAGSIKLCLDTYKGECEAYSYTCTYYPLYQKANNTRFINQSMKTYLKLIKRYGEQYQNEDLEFVKQNIDKIDKFNIGIAAKLFYFVFKISKDLAWLLFKVLKLS